MAKHGAEHGAACGKTLMSDISFSAFLFNSFLVPRADPDLARAPWLSMIFELGYITGNSEGCTTEAPRIKCLDSGRRGRGRHVSFRV